MTHDELLDNITAEADGWANLHGLTNNYLEALRAVVELHKEYGDINGRTWCDECEGTGYDYPCPTIEVITEELL